MIDEIKATRRVIAPLTPTEEPITLRRTSRPVVKDEDLADGVRCVGVEADHFRGMWYAILDITGAAPHLDGKDWAPGIFPPLLIPEASIRAVQGSTGQPASPSTPRSPLILPDPHPPTPGSRLTLP